MYIISTNNIYISILLIYIYIISTNNIFITSTNNIYINYNIIRQDLNWVRRYLGIIPPVFHENLKY